MTIQRQEIFEHDGKKFEIQLIETIDGFAAAAYVDGKQVSCFHSIKHTTNFGFYQKFGASWIPQLFIDVKDDITSGRYQLISDVPNPV